MRNFNFKNFEKSMDNLKRNIAKASRKLNKSLEEFEQKIEKALEQANDKIDDFQEENMNHECNCEHCKCHCHDEVDEVQEAVEPEFDNKNEE